MNFISILVLCLVLAFTVYQGYLSIKTFIEMSEKGTRAAAVTAIIEKNSVSFQEEGKRVYLNRPFVYVIMDDETNLPIFIGTVLEIE